MKAPRQLLCCKIACMGAVDAIAPIPPTDSSSAVDSGRRSCGSHSEQALIAAINEPATPKPIRARETISSVRLCALANSAAPRVAISNIGTCTLRGPNRSSATPTGSWAAAKAKKYAPVSRPMLSAASPRSCARSG